MTLAHEITVSEAAIRQGRLCGLYGDTEARVRGLAASATVTNHPAGNRMYGPFVMHLRGGNVVSITLVGPREVDNRPVTECKICRGMMVRRVPSNFEGRVGTASRPCARAFDPTQPLCDTVKTRRD